MSIFRAIVKRKCSKQTTNPQHQEEENKEPEAKVMFTLSEAIAVYEAERRECFPLRKPERVRY
jgi:hypothetical protein